jgi:hypothetical protein
LGSVATVSSLEDEDIDDILEETIETPLTVDGVGILNLGLSSPRAGYLLTHKRNSLRTSPKRREKIVDLCSLDSTDQKLRNLEQMVVTHELCNAFGHRPRRQSSKDENEGEHSKSSIEEIMEEEGAGEEEVVEDDGHEAEVRRVVSRMHQSMVITAPVRRIKTHHLSSRRRDDDSDVSDDDSITRSSRKYSLDDLDGSANDGEDFLNDVEAAKKYLANLAKFRAEAGVLEEISMGRPRNHSQDGSVAMYSSDDYTEVLVSSDDSFGFEEEEILEEIVSSPLKSAPSRDS